MTARRDTASRGHLAHRLRRSRRLECRPAGARSSSSRLTSSNGLGGDAASEPSPSAPTEGGVDSRCAIGLLPQPAGRGAVEGEDVAVEYRDADGRSTLVRRGRDRAAAVRGDLRIRVRESHRAVITETTPISTWRRGGRPPAPASGRLPCRRVSTCSSSTARRSNSRGGSPWRASSSSTTTPRAEWSGRRPLGRSGSTSGPASVLRIGTLPRPLPVVDADRVQRLLRGIAARLRELEAERAAGPEAASPSRWLNSIKYLFVTAIEGCLDVAHHLAASEQWGAPDTNASAFALLARHDVLPATLAQTMASAAGFRNVLVHQYATVDDERVGGVPRAGSRAGRVRDRGRRLVGSPTARPQLNSDLCGRDSSAYDARP